MPPSNSVPDATTEQPINPPNPIYAQLSDARDLIGNVADGDLVVAGIAGPPGLGKTHLAETTLIERGYKALEEGETPTTKSYMVFNGTVAALIQLAYLMRQGGVVILDDADGLFMQGGLTGVNTMKQLLLDKPERLITHYTEKARENEERDPDKQKTIAPPRFTTRIRFIVCSNEDYTNASERMRPHIGALQSRGLQLVRLSTNPRDHLDYVLDLIADRDLLMSPKTPHVGLRGAQEIADWLCERGYYPRPGVSVRTATTAAKMRRMHPDSWRRKMEREALTIPVLPASELPPHRMLVPPRASALATSRPLHRSTPRGVTGRGLLRASQKPHSGKSLRNFFAGSL